MDQVSCAIEFHDKNYAGVMRVQGLVLEAAQRFLDGIAKNLIPEEINVEARVALRRADLADYVHLIRKYATAFVGAKISTQYWSMIDACNFYMDATTSRWRYITMERRNQNLIWAEEDATQV